MEASYVNPGEIKVSLHCVYFRCTKKYHLFCFHFLRCIVSSWKKWRNISKKHALHFVLCFKVERLQDWWISFAWILLGSQPDWKELNCSDQTYVNQIQIYMILEIKPCGLGSRIWGWKLEVISFIGDITFYFICKQNWHCGLSRTLNQSFLTSNSLHNHGGQKLSCLLMLQHKEFWTNSLKSTFLWDIWFGRDAVKNIDEMIAGPVNG